MAAPGDAARGDRRVEHFPIGCPIRSPRTCSGFKTLSRSLASGPLGAGAGRAAGRRAPCPDGCPSRRPVAAPRCGAGGSRPALPPVRARPSHRIDLHRPTVATIRFRHFSTDQTPLSNSPPDAPCIPRPPVADTAPHRTGPAGTRVRCGSSVVEHSLGKGEVESSILSRSTIHPLVFAGVEAVSWPRRSGALHCPARQRQPIRRQPRAERKPPSPPSCKRPDRARRRLSGLHDPRAFAIDSRRQRGGG